MKDKIEKGEHIKTKNGWFCVSYIDRRPPLFGPPTPENTEYYYWASPDDPNLSHDFGIYRIPFADIVEVRPPNDPMVPQ